MENRKPAIFSPQLNKLRALYLSCVNCLKELDIKRVRRMQGRCKKCEREYAAIWPADSKEFYEMFDGQR